MPRLVALLVTLTAACGGPAAAPPAAPSSPPPAEAAPVTLVPPSVDYDDEEALRAQLADEVAAAAAGRARTVTIHVRTTADYGCRCAPFVFAPFHNGPDPFVMLIAPPAALPPADLVGGTIRVTGRFDGRRLDGLTWAREVGYPVPTGPDIADGWGHEGPGFVVDGWCWELPPAGDEDRAAYADRFDALARAGKGCAS